MAVSVRRASRARRALNLVQYGVIAAANANLGAAAAVASLMASTVELTARFIVITNPRDSVAQWRLPLLWRVALNARDQLQFVNNNG